MRFLVVEQDSAVRGSIVRLLGAIVKTPEISQVDCAEAAVAILEQDSNFDLALIDYGMAGKDGLWLIHWISKKQLKLGCVLMSGGMSNPPGDIIFLGKPFSKEELAASIRKAGFKEV